MTAQLPTRSLLRQTVAAVVFSQCFCAFLLCAGALLHEQHTHFLALDIRLQGRVDSVLGAIQDAEDPGDNVSLDPAELRVPGDDIFAVYNLGGRCLGGSANPPPGLVEGNKDGFRDLRVNNISYRVLQRSGLRIIDRTETKGVGLRRPVTIVYASPNYLIWHQIFKAARFYLVASLLAAALTAFLVAALLRRLLAPISELSSAAASISAPNLIFAPPPAVLSLRELRPLADVLTTSVASLRTSFEKEQRFVSDAAHELKTAVAVVRSSLQLLLLRPRAEAEYVQGLQQVVEDNARVETVVAQMLTLARSQETKAADLPVSDLLESARAAVNSLQAVAQQRELSLCLIGEAAKWVRLKPEDAFVMVSNLVMNALQHSRAGYTVVVTVFRHPEQGVVLKVVDQGSGIRAEALPYVFDRFYRDDISRSRQTGGTGLGLAICASIVTAAAGTIHVESTINIGTTITVTFSAA